MAKENAYFRGRRPPARDGRNAGVSGCLFLFASMIAVILACSGPAAAVTLDEAVSRALEVSFSIKEQSEIVKSTEYSYTSTIDPYLPRVDIASSYNRLLNTPDSFARSTDATLRSSRDSYSFVGTLSYRLFDGGERYAKRKEALFLSEREKERWKGTRADVIFSAKTKFFAALGLKAVVDKRREALETTQKIYELTKGRYDEGVVKKSDLLQSEVRLSTTKIELFNARMQYEKALEDLKSLLLAGSDSTFNVVGELVSPQDNFDQGKLIERALTRRPEVTAQVKEVKRLEMVYKERRSAWFPKIDAKLIQTRVEKSFFPNNREDIFAINFSYPLFDGVGKYYNVKAATSDVQASNFRLSEIKRTVEFEVIKALKDYAQSREDVVSFEALLREATSNFNQAYGEYQYGKGDILTLFTAERDLARAKENLVIAIYFSNNTLASVERVAYLSDNTGE